MRDLLPFIDAGLQSGRPVALATVIETWGSAPRAAGAKMALAPDNQLAGSVSGGCVEGAVYEAGLEVLRQGRARWLHFGVADETAWEVGLACGGQLDVFVQPLEPAWLAAWRQALQTNQPFAALTIVRGPDEALGRTRLLSEGRAAHGSLGAELDAAVEPLARAALAEGHSQRLVFGAVEIFLEAVWPPPRLVIVGGVHLAQALVELARPLGYQTLVVDPRAAFGNALRFPRVDQLIQAWPDEAWPRLGVNAATAVAALTHDPKLDDPALQLALAGPAFYVGALGSRATQAKRRARLLAAGLTAAQVDRLRGPIGLDLGGRAPEEIALAILAEMVAARHGRLRPGASGEVA